MIMITLNSVCRREGEFTKVAKPKHPLKVHVWEEGGHQSEGENESGHLRGNNAQGVLREGNSWRSTDSFHTR